MDTALTITGLTKKYSNFTLDNISFSIPSTFYCGGICTSSPFADFR